MIRLGVTRVGLALAGLLALLMVTAGGARGNQATVRVTLDGAELAFDVPGQIVDGRTLVPLRGIFEALGATVEWDAETRTVTAVRGADTLELTIGSRIVTWRRSILVADVAPVVVDGRTLVPLRFIGQALGIHVSWDVGTRTAVLQTRPDDPLLARGLRIVHEKSCMVCHTFGGVGGNVGPVLDGVPRRYGEDWLRAWLRNPQAMRQGSRMPNFGFTEEDIGAVIAFLRTLE